MINMAGLMRSTNLGARDITLRRPNPVQYTHLGEAAYSYADATINALVQPATPVEIQMLPEGTRIGNVIHVWSDTVLQCADGKSEESDILVVDGQSYRVIKINDWRQAGFTDAFAEGFVTA